MIGDNGQKLKTHGIVPEQNIFHHDKMLNSGTDCPETVEFLSVEIL